MLMMMIVVNLHRHPPKTNPKRRIQMESNGGIGLCPSTSELEISKGVLCGMLQCVQFLAF